METKVAVNDMTQVRLMESPGPGHGHRGFLVQRNHEFGEIVIVYSLPEGCGSGNSATSTFCNRDIFAIPAFGQTISTLATSGKTRPVPQSPRERSASRDAIMTENGECFRAQRVSPDMGVPGLSD